MVEMKYMIWFIDCDKSLKLLECLECLKYLWKEFGKMKQKG